MCEHNKFVYSCIDGHLWYFQCLVIKNKTGINFFVHISVKCTGFSRAYPQE